MAEEAFFPQPVNEVSHCSSSSLQGSGTSDRERALGAAPSVPHSFFVPLYYQINIFFDRQIFLFQEFKPLILQLGLFLLDFVPSFDLQFVSPNRLSYRLQKGKI